MKVYGADLVHPSGIRWYDAETNKLHREGDLPACVKIGDNMYALTEVK